MQKKLARSSIGSHATDGNTMTENPYHHPDYKPHVVDRGEIRRLAFELAAIIKASATRIDSAPALEAVMFEDSEAEISRRLLRIALLVRTLDETMSRPEIYPSKKYEAYRTKVESSAVLGQYFEEFETYENSIRQCCNRIVHADDLRPVYESYDDENPKASKWQFIGDIEIEGSHRGREWFLTLEIFPFLEAVLRLAAFGEKEFN